jgi:hypothetical protein
VSESNNGDELEEVWVPKDAGELEGLLLTIQNEPGKRILKHKIQQVVKEKRRGRLEDQGSGNWEDTWSGRWSGDTWSLWLDGRRSS